MDLFGAGRSIQISRAQGERKDGDVIRRPHAGAAYRLHKESHYMEAPTEIQMCKVCATAARTARAWKAHRDANHNKASSHDVQESAPGQERPRSRAFQTQGRLESMVALRGLVVWWHEQQLAKQMFWTAGLFDEIEDDILEARDIAFVMGYLDEEEAEAVEEERLPPGPAPPPPQSTPPPQLLPPVKEAEQLPL